MIVKQYPEDYIVWNALGNIYADMENFSKSFDCFEKALEIIPDDPYIMREYALALRDSGNKEKAYEMRDKIVEKYWFLDIGFERW